MKKTVLQIITSLLFSLPVANAQIGTPFVNDVCNDMVFSQWDGTFISCGSKGPNGSIYKTDCSGAIVAQLEINLSPISTTFWGAVELADGSLIAVGSAFVANAIDTVEAVVVLKANPDLTAYISSSFNILNKAARAKAVTLSKNGQLLLIGEVAGVSMDVTDMFFQRVDPVTLQPAADPVIYNNGVDLAAKIIPLADEYFLICGSNFSGNIFNPVAQISNKLIAIKVNDEGVAQWTYQYEKKFAASNGVSQCGGAAQSSLSGNIVLSGTEAGDSTGLDPVMLLISNNGMALDTISEGLPEIQTLLNTIEYRNWPGIFIAVGGSENPGAGTPNLFVYQIFEFDNQFVQWGSNNDLTQLFSISDLVEYETDRFAFAFSFPDNFTLLGLKDYFIDTPALEVEAFYEGCYVYTTGTINAGALTPSLSYQWYVDGMPIPDRNDDLFIPDITGNYYVVVSDAAGCSAISDTVYVDFLSAGFTYNLNDLTCSFSNTSIEADAYTWHFGDNDTSTQVNPVHTYFTSGVYTVTLSATNDCGESIFTEVVALLSPVQEPSWLTSFNLAPNPGNGFFTVDMVGQPRDLIDFSLYSQMGQKVYHEQVDFQTGALKKLLDFNHLPGGVYALQVNSMGEMKYIRVMLER